MAVLEAPARLISAEEFFSMPEVRTHELIQGELIPVAPPTFDHGDIAGEIYSQLKAFLRRTRVGRASVESGFVLRREPDVVRFPDVAFLESSRLPVPKRGFVSGPPTLAVEVVSPGDTWREVEDKVQLYLEVGVKVVWIVSEEDARIHVRTPDGQHKIYERPDVLDGGELLPGFQMPLSEVFESWDE